MAMASKRKTRFAILGLLSWQPMSGYDIKKLVDAGLSHFWQENYGQIYPTLEQLVKEGLAKKRAERKSGNRRRFVYTITREGTRAFRNWLVEPTESPVVRNELQLKFFLTSNLPVRNSIRLIEEYQSRQQTLLEAYRRSETLLRKAIDGGESPRELDELLAISGPTSQVRMKQLDRFYLTLRHGIRVIEARLAWCAEALESLKP